MQSTVASGPPAPTRNVPFPRVVPGERIRHSERVAGKPLPPPEWFDEMRRLHLSYATEYEAIRRLPISEVETTARAGDLWFETNERKKLLLKQAVKGLPCRATKADGQPCTRRAIPDYIGQMCGSHAPPVAAWPGLEETRTIWLEREGNRS